MIPTLLYYKNVLNIKLYSCRFLVAHFAQFYSKLSMHVYLPISFHTRLPIILFLSLSKLRSLYKNALSSISFYFLERDVFPAYLVMKAFPKAVHILHCRIVLKRIIAAFTVFHTHFHLNSFVKVHYVPLNCAEGLLDSHSKIRFI